MRNGYRVADSDMHIFEPADLWQRYIDPKFRERAPVGSREWARDPRVFVDGTLLPPQHRRRARPGGQPVMASVAEADRFARALARGFDPASQLEAMDAEGLDLAVLFPTRGLIILGLNSAAYDAEHGVEPAYADAIARAYNDWLADFCAAEPSRLFGCGLIAAHDIDHAVAETRRCVEQLGFKAIFFQPGAVDGRPWHDPYYDPLWAECQRLDIPVAFHGGTQSYLTPGDFSVQPVGDSTLMLILLQPIGLISALSSCLIGGIFERFPRLRMAFLEGNCSWVPWLIERMDDYYDLVGKHEYPETRKKPSEYFRANCFVSVEPDEKTVKSYVEWLGDDNVVFSTDYPHGDSKFPRAVAGLLELPVSEASKRKFLWDNWCRLYAFPAGITRDSEAARSS